MIGKVKVLAFMLSVSTILVGVSGGSYLASRVLPSNTAADVTSAYEVASSGPSNGLSATKVTSEAAADIAAKFMAAQAASSEAVSSEESSEPITELPEVNEEVVEEAVKQDASTQDHSDDVLPDRGQTGGGDSGIVAAAPVLKVPLLEIPPQGVLPEPVLPAPVPLKVKNRPMRTDGRPLEALHTIIKMENRLPAGRFLTMGNL